MSEINKDTKMVELAVDLDFDQNIDVLTAERSEILKNKNAQIITKEINDETVVTCIYKDQIRTFEDLNLVLEFNFTKDIFKSMNVSVAHHQINENDLELYIYKNIQIKLLNSVYKENSSKYTVRVYKCIFNKTTIKGVYTINWGNKIQMFPLMDFEKDESFSEHIIVFDVEVRAVNLDQARSMAYNIVSDFTAFLSLLIDVGFQDLRSKYMNFLMKDNFGRLQASRYRTGAYDKELGLYIKDNFYGITPEDKPGYDYGPIYLLPEEMKTKVTYQIDSDAFLEDKFKNREIKKKSTMKNEYLEGSFAEIHNPYNSIKVPRKIREYFREIKQLEEKNVNKYEFFRNASRIYALAKNIEQFNETSAISYMVASVEALGKSEKMSFSEICRKYLGEDVDLKLLDYLYGNVRSGHFHSGEFAFLEYEVNFNRSMDSLYTNLIRKNRQAKKSLRKVLVSWIEDNLNMRYN
ncbi:hypothetical protein PaeCFBP13512_06275 [Paenibacillus sp. CFBP13512]|uniref:hypothetical protein n=1 Tax=Paenibacillus sp. CFBP13512 TaxID=2184007 RepID=UPI0010BF9C25|nr:hypothetical protein [Paenibacillus sp. CFBP13512]TKJ92950.1 hypothetical protein PaeCFBP13512_06275 [Paenibacillus sp. CFBP13512]